MRLFKTVTYSFLNGCGIEISYLALGIVVGTYFASVFASLWLLWLLIFVALYTYISRVWWKQVKKWSDNFTLTWMQLLLYKAGVGAFGIFIGSYWPMAFAGKLSILLLLFIILDLITAATYLEG